MKRFLRLAGFLGTKAGTHEEQAKHFKLVLNDWTLDGIVNTEFTDVAHVANAARNIEILCERFRDKKRNMDGDRIRPAEVNSQKGYEQRSYDQHGEQRNYDHRGSDKQSDYYQRSKRDHSRQSNRDSGSSYQKKYPDEALSPPCDTCGKLYPGKPCHKVT